MRPGRASAIWTAFEGPPGVVTVMVAGPAAWGGLVTVICVPESEVGETMVPPKLTVAPLRLVPLIVTVVPPAVLPPSGEKKLRIGGGDGVL